MSAESHRRRGSTYRRLAMLAALGVTVVSWSPLSRSASNDGDVSPDMANLVKRVQGSTQRHSYSGTYVVSAGGALTSARIVHVCDGSDQVERIEALDGQMRQMFRHNDTVHVLWPKAREAVVQQREPTSDFPTPLLGATKHSLSMYEVHPGGMDRIAGLDAQIITLKPKDGLRFAQRWWLEQHSSLLLRSDTLNERGETIESAAFSELQIGSKLSMQQLLQQMNRLDGYHVQRPILARTTLDSEGWGLRTHVAGFEAISSVRRPLLTATTPDSLANSASAGPSALAAVGGSGEPRGAERSGLLQTIFSDGLTHISLFIEPYNAELHRSEAPVVMGATHALAHRVGNWWITAVGDVPTATLKQFAFGLERRKP